MLIKYPKVALINMWNCFIRSTGIILNEDGTTKQVTNVRDALLIYDLDTAPGQWWSNINSLLKRPLLGEKVREKTIQILGCVNENRQVIPLYFIFYNLWIPLMLILLCLIYREWFKLLLFITIFTRVIMIFISAVSPYIMYYLSVYMLAYFMAGIILIQIIENKKSSKQIKV